MICTLHIKNIGIIDDITIDLNKGFNVLTGETGAGKSLIIDSLSILSGARISKEIIKKGAEYCLVEAEIFLPISNISEDNYIIVYRQFFSNGRNVCKINGNLVTVTELKKFMQDVIDIHGQHENQKLMRVSNHIDILDKFSGDDLLELRKEYEKLYENYLQLKEDLRKNYGDERERKRKLDLLNYELNEIEDANLKDGEEEILENKRKIINNYERIYEVLGSSNMVLDNSILVSLEKVMQGFYKISNFDDNYSDTFKRITSCYYELEDIAANINSNLNNIEYDQEEVNRICNRIDLISSLKRKYGSSISDILVYKTELQSEIERLNNIDDYICNIKDRITNIEEKMYNIACKMHLIREEKAICLEERINTNLEALEMKNAMFKTKIEFSNAYEFNELGLDKVEFLISTNVGEDLKELTKIVSGGELSRIMLAIKAVTASVDEVPIMIFDEIDTGIGGKAARAVAKKIREISKNHQVICVTHLAVVAAFSDYNFHISKKVIGNKTRTEVNLLSDNSVVEEVARMATGEVTDVALQYAKELISQKIA